MSALIQFPITRQVNTERDSAMQNYKQGFAVFTRSLLHAEWAQDAFMLAAWSRLVLKACHTKRVLHFNGQDWELERGQLVLIPARFANELRDRRGTPLSRQTVIRMLEWFERDGMIERAGFEKGTVITIINYDAYQTPIRPVQSGQPTGQLTGQENEQPSGHLNTSNGAACASDAGQENEQPSGHQTGHLTGSEEQQLITTINNKIKDQNLSVSASPSDEPTPNNPEDSNQSDPVQPEKPQKQRPEDAAVWSNATKTPRWGTADDLKVANWFVRIRAAAFKHKGLSEPKEEPIVNYANTIRLMREQDHRNHHDICALFDWVCRTGRELEFCQCPKKLRVKWDELQLRKANKEAADAQRANRFGNITQAQSRAQAIINAGGGYSDDDII